METKSKQSNSQLKDPPTQEGNTDSFLGGRIFSSDLGQARSERLSVPEAVRTNVKAEDFHGYTGTNINPFVTDIEKFRAQEQSHWAQLGNFGMQAGAEVIGGTIEGIGYIAGLPEAILKTAGDSQISFGEALMEAGSNALSESGRAIKEASRETFPIYQENPGSFNPSDPGWWAKNGVSVFSTLSLLIPAVGTTRAIGAGVNLARRMAGLNKMSRGSTLLKSMSKVSPRAAKALDDVGITGTRISQAAFSRHAENLMEATPLFEEKYKEYIEKGLSEDMAREKAGEAAAISYKANSLFLLQDIGTFGLLGKASRSIRGVPGAKMTTWGQSLLEMGTEGIEEAYQYAVEKEAGIRADISAGVRDPSEFGERIGAYMNGEMATGAVFGALGSGLFRAVGSRVESFVDSKDFQKDLRESLDRKAQQKQRETEQQRQEQTTQDENVEPAPVDLREGEVQETEQKVRQKKARETATSVKNNINSNRFLDEQIVKAAQSGIDVTPQVAHKAIKNATTNKASGQPFTEVDRVVNLSEEEFVAEFGEDPIVPQSEFSKIKEVVDNIPTWYENNRHHPRQIAESITRKQALQRFTALRNQAIDADIKGQLQGDESYNHLTKKGQEQLERRIRINALTKGIAAQKEAGHDESVEWMQKELDKEKEIYKRNQSKERKNEDDLNDNSIVQSMEPEIERLSSLRRKREINQSLISHYANEIKALQKKSDQYKSEKEKYEEAETEEDREELDFISPEDNISREVPSMDDLEMEDSFFLGENPEAKLKITRDNDGRKVVRTPGGQLYPYEQYRDAIAGMNTSVHKVIPPSTAQKEATADLTEEEAKEHYREIPDDYEDAPVKDETKTNKETIQSAAWKSTRNPDHPNPEDPDEVARANWAEQPMSMKLPNGRPRYYVEFERAPDDAFSEEQDPIRAYVVDRTSGERVIENDREVFFYVHEPGFKNTRDNNPTKAIKEFRKEILDAIERGEQPISPIESKTEGNFRFGGEIADIRTITGQEDPILAISDKSGNYQNKFGIPEGFDRLTDANPSQTGRVYTLVQALNGKPKVLPLERKTLTEDMATTVASITRDLARGAQPGDTISTETYEKLTSREGEKLKQYLGEQPTNKEVLDHIVLEGAITNKMRKAEQKRFHIDFDNNLIRYGGEAVSFNDYVSDASNMANLTEFLQTRHINVLRSKLGEPSYNNWLIGEEILYQTNELPLLIQPTLKFGGVYSRQHEAEPSQKALDESQPENSDVANIPFEGKNYTAISNDRGIMILNPNGNQVELDSKLGRNIMAQRPELFAKGERPPWIQEDTEEGQTPDEGDVDEAFGDMLGFQKLAMERTMDLKPILDGLSRRFGINYVALNLPDSEWSGVYQDDTAFINMAKAGDDTPFHEFAHPIIRQIKENNPILYNELRREIRLDDTYHEIFLKVRYKYPEYSREQAFEEAIVQSIGQIAAMERRSQNVLRKLWSKIKEYIRSIFTTRDVNDLSEGMTLRELGELIGGHSFLNVEQNPMTAYQDRPDMSYGEQNSWVNSMVYILINASNVSTYKDASNLDFQKLREKLEGLSQSSTKLRDIMGDLFTEEGVNPNSIWYKLINDKLKKFNISPEQELQDMTTDGENSFDFRPDYLFDGKDKASTFIKMIFSTVPRINRYEDARWILQKNRDTGMPDFYSFNEMWNTVNRTLSDTVESFDESGNVNDLFEDMMDKLQREAHLKPELKYIISKFQNSPQWQKAKFVSTFFKADQNYSMMIYDGQMKLLKNQPTSVENRISSLWNETFKRNWFDEDGNINEADQKKIQQKYDRLRKDWNAHYKEVPRNVDAIQDWNYVDRFQEILDSMGLEFGDRAMEYLLLSHESGNMNRALNEYITSEGLNRLIEGQSGITNLRKYNQETFVENQRFARTLINAKAKFSQDLGTASVFGPDNNDYHIYSNWSVMKKQLAYYKENPRLLQKLKNTPFYRGSKWANEDIINNLEITNAMSFKTRGGEGIKMKSLSPLDRVLIDINKMLQGQASFMARGANTTEFNIRGFPVEKSWSSSEMGILLNSEAVDALAGYIYDEIERVRATEQYIEEGDENTFIEGYHTGPQTGLKTFLAPDILDNLGLSENISRENFIANSEVRKGIQGNFRNRVNELQDFLIENGMTNEEASKKISNPNNNINYDSSNPFRSKVYDYIYNGMVANIEQQKLFAADTAMFAKDGDNIVNATVAEMQKRILANGSMGTSWYVQEGENPHYKSAVIKDVMYESKVYDSYDRVNVADAQAWVTFDFYVDALKGFGKWGPEYDASLQRIQDGTWRDSDVQLFAQPLKTVHFERVDHADTVMPVYDKQTIMPLIPQAIKGTSLQNLLKNMRNEGVDHVTVESGKKLGRVAPTEAIDPETLEFKEDFKLHPIRQSKLFTFLQTEMPTKGRGNLLQGSQQKYNIMADLKDDLTFDGRDLKGELHRTQSALSNVSTQRFLDEISTEGQIDQEKLYNKLIELTTAREVDRNLVNYLKRGMPIESIPAYNYRVQNVIMAHLRKIGAQYEYSNGFRGIQASRVGYDNLSKREKSDITWLADKPSFAPPRHVNGKLNKGQVLVPHSILEEYNLDPSNYKDRSLLKKIVSGVDYRIPNQSISNIGMVEAIGILPEYMGDTIVVYGELNEKSGSDNDGDKVDVLFYNYVGKDKPEKVKYWAEGNPETLKKIHKYRTEVLDENLPDVEEFVEEHKDSILEANSQRGIENYLLDLYEEVLSDPDAFERSTETLEDNMLKNLITNHPEYENRSIETLEYASPFFQTKVRNSFINANSGVGQDSNHILDHVKSQGKDIYVTTDTGAPWKMRGVKTNTIEVDYEGEPAEATLMDERDNVNGDRISKILSMIMTAHVDAEKDDYAPRGNFNTQTNSIALTMVRAGVPLNDIVDIIGSSMVRSYSNKKIANKNKLLPYKINAFEETLIEHGYTKENDDGEAVIDEERFNKESDNPLRIYRDFEKVSASLSKSIQLTRFSVNGAGRSFASAVAYEKFRDIPIKHLARVDQKFEEAGGPSIEETSYQNSVMVSRKLFENQSIAYGDQFHRALDQLRTETRFEPISLISGDTTPTENVYFDFYGYVMSGIFSDVNREELIRGDNTLAHRVRDYDGDNAFINYLIPVRLGRTDTHLLQTSNQTKVDEDLSNEFSEAWTDLYKEDPELALDLARYSYFQSNFKRNLHSFHEFMPPEVNEALGIPERFSELQSEDAFDGFVDQYIRHNIDNDDLVPRLSKARNEEGKITDYERYKDMLIVQPKDRYTTEDGDMVRFLKLERRRTNDTIDELWERVGAGVNKKTAAGVQEIRGVGIYRRSPKLGYNRRGNRYYEYDLESTQKTPMFDNTEYPVVRETTSEQRESSSEQISMEEFQQQRERIASITGWDIEFDQSLEQSAIVSGNKIIANPNKLFKDTLVHEVGHILIDSIGGLDNPMVRRGLKQLEGTQLATDVRERYSDMSEDIIQKEILATAIGMQAADIFGNRVGKISKWKRWLDLFLRRIKQVLGIEPNVAREMAEQIIYHNPEMVYDSSQQYEQRDSRVQKIRNEIQKIKANLRSEAQNLRNKEVENYEERVEELQNLVSRLEKAELEISVASYITTGHRKVKQLLEDISVDEELSFEELRRIKEDLSAYENIEHLRSKLDALDFENAPLENVGVEESKQIFEEAGELVKNINLVRNRYFDRAKEKIAEKMSTASNGRVHQQYKEKFEEQFNERNIDSSLLGLRQKRTLEGERVDKGEYEAARSAYVTQQMQKYNEKIVEEEKQYLRDILDKTPSDIGWIEYFSFDSAAINDDIIQIVTELIERAEKKVQSQYLKKERDLYEAFQEFKENNPTPTNQQKRWDFLLADELDEDGNPTGNKIPYLKSEYNPSFYIAKRKLHQEWQDLANEAAEIYVDYKTNNTKYEQEYREVVEKKNTAEEKYKRWVKNNTIKTGGTQRPTEKWRTQQDLTSSQRKMREEVMGIIDEIESNYPAGGKIITQDPIAGDVIRMPSVNKTTIEKWTDGNIFENALESFKDIYTPREEDTEYESVSQAISKATRDNKLHYSIPIHYRTKTRDQSFDVLSAFMMDYYQSLNYKHKRQIESEIIAYKDISRKRAVGETTSSIGDGVRSIQNFFGKNDDLIIEKDQDEEVANRFKALKALIDARMYGVRRKGNETTNRIVDSAISFTSLAIMPANVFSAISNVVMGKSTSAVEVIGDAIPIGKREAREAEKEYMSRLIGTLGDVGKPKVDSFMNKIMEKYDSMGDFYGPTFRFAEDSRFKQMFNRGVLYTLTTMVEHYIHGTLTIGGLKSLKLQNKQGQYISKEGKVVENRDEAATMFDYLSIEGGEIVYSDIQNAHKTDRFDAELGSEEHDFLVKQYIRDLAAQTQGQYDNKAFAVSELNVFARMFFGLRDWIPRGLARNWRGVSYVFSDQIPDEAHFYSKSTSAETLGYQTQFLNTAVKSGRAFRQYLNSLRTDGEKLKFDIVKQPWQDLTFKEKARVRKAIAKYVMASSAAAISAMLLSLEEDEEDIPDEVIYLVYALERTKQELLFYVNPSQTLRILRSPAASISMLENGIHLSEQLLSDFFNAEFERYERGRFEGQAKVKKDLQDVLPVFSQLNRDVRTSLSYIKSLSASD